REESVVPDLEERRRIGIGVDGHQLAAIRGDLDGAGLVGAGCEALAGVVARLTGLAAGRAAVTRLAEPGVDDSVAARRGAGAEVQRGLTARPERSRQNGAVIGDERLDPDLGADAGALTLREDHHDGRALLLPAS